MYMLVIIVGWYSERCCLSIVEFIMSVYMCKFKRVPVLMCLLTVSCTLTYPRREHGEVKEDGCIPDSAGQTNQLGDGFERSEGLVDSNGQLGRTGRQLLLDIMCLTITCTRREVVLD